MFSTTSLPLSTPSASSASSSSLLLSKKPRIDSPLPSPSEESSLIWKQGAGPTTTGSALVKLAQNGYTREAHKIIELSRISSLVGRKSDGGLPELWDVMGRRRGKGGITRLMAVCITRGPLSPQRARSLIQDHNASLREKDDRGRTALHHALGARHEARPFYFFDEKEEISDPWPDDIPVNIDLIQVLLELDPEGVKFKDDNGKTALHWAFRSNCSYEVVKLIYDAFPFGLNEKLEEDDDVGPFRCASAETLTIFAREKFVRKNGHLAYVIANAMGGRGDEEIIRAGGVLALVDLLKEKAVREHHDALYCVTEDLMTISINKKGNQVCVDAHVPFALVPLIRDKFIIEKDGLVIDHAVYALKNIACTKNGAIECTKAGAPKALIELMSIKKADNEILEAIVDALINISFSKSGMQASLNEGIVLTLTQILKEKGVEMAVAKNDDPLESITQLFRRIEWKVGCQPFIEAGTYSILISLLREKKVLEIGNAVNNIAQALFNITTGDGIQSFLDADGPAALITLAQEKSVKENGKVADSVVCALCSVTVGNYYPDIKAVIDAGAILVITNLLCEKAVMKSVDAVAGISYNLEELVKYEDGRKACVTAGTPSVVIALLRGEILKNIDAICVLADILGDISKNKEGCQLCIDSGAALVLTNVAREAAISYCATESVARTLWTLALSDAGKQACVDANAASALATLANNESIMKDDCAAESINGALQCILDTGAALS